MAQYEKLINLSLLNQFLTKAKTIFAPKISASGILKGDGAGNVSAATAGTDYATPALVKVSDTQPTESENKLWVDTDGSGGNTPLYYKDSQGNYQRILTGADMTGYRTAAAQDTIDAGLVSAAAAQNLTAAQQAQARANIGAASEWELLWENASPTSAFAAQTLTLDLSEYSEIEIVYIMKPADSSSTEYYKMHISYAYRLPGFGWRFSLGGGFQYVGPTYYQIAERVIDDVSDSGIQFSQCFYMHYGDGKVTGSTDLRLQVPCYIYGRK